MPTNSGDQGLDRAEKTWELVQSMPAGGRAVFTVPRPPVSCTGTTVEALFLAAARSERTGRLPGVDITLVIDRRQSLADPHLDSRLLNHLRDLGVRVLHDTTVTELQPDERQIIVTDHGGTTQQLPYDLLHLVRHSGARAGSRHQTSPDNPHGLVDIDPHTLRHGARPNVWAAADGAGVDTDPSGGASRQQISVWVDNLLAARTAGDLTDYDGYRGPHRDQHPSAHRRGVRPHGLGDLVPSLVRRPTQAAPHGVGLRPLRATAGLLESHPQRPPLTRPAGINGRSRLFRLYPPVQLAFLLLKAANLPT